MVIDGENQSGSQCLEEDTNCFLQEKQENNDLRCWENADLPNQHHKATADRQKRQIGCTAKFISSQSPMKLKRSEVRSTALQI